jgi:hypothetical protein
MKRTGAIILVIGLMITVFTGFNFITRKKVVDLGALEITQNKNHELTWSPFIGVTVIVIGGAVYLFGRTKQ